MKNFPQAKAPTTLAEMAALEQKLREMQGQLDTLRESEERFRASFEQAAVGMGHIAPDGRFLRVNDKLCEILGYGRHELLAMLVEEATLSQDRQRCEQARREMLRSPFSTSTMEKRHRRKDGEVVWVKLVTTLERTETGEPEYFIVVFEDITARKAGEEKLARINRGLKMLSACNEALFRAEQEQELLETICHIVVKYGGYRMAWVGFAQHDEQRSISPQAHAGVEDGYLSEVKITWDENSPSGRGPAGVAIRTGAPAMSADDALQHHPALPWRVKARQRGYRDIICLPLRNGNLTFGILVLYSAEVKLVSPEELRLLQEMANDLAFGITTLRTRAEQRRLQAVVLKVAAGVSAATGEEFFVQLARNMAEALGAQAGFVTQLIPGDEAVARTLAVVVDGVVMENFEYAITGTPAEGLFRSETCVIARGAGHRLHHCPAPALRGAEGYVGRRLEDSKDQPLGHLSVVFREPLEKVEFINSTLQIFAARAASELERQKTDSQVRKQAALLDIAHEAIYAEDLKGRVIYWNKGAEQTYGWRAEEVLGRKSAEILRPDPAILRKARTALVAQDGWQGETIKRTKDGRELVVEVGWTLVRDAQGEPRSVLAIDTDITARRRAEEELARSRENMLSDLEQRVAQRTQDLVAAKQEAERANQAKSEFLSRMSHELRTPLHAILGFAQLLEKEAQSAEDGYGVAQIARAGKHLLGLIDEVLDIARVESGKLEIRLDPVNVRVTLMEAMSLVKTQAATHQILLEPLVGYLDCEVLSNAQRLRQVLVNLLSNAVKFNSAGGAVSVVCERVGKSVRIEVADTGRGIAPKNQARIFVPFERLEGDHAGVEGAGLGLSISKHLVEAMNGKIGLKSMPGEGATFWIELPLSPRSSARRALHHDALPLAQVATIPSLRATVLCIEDNLSNLRLIERILARRPDVKLTTALQGVAGLQLARQEMPDLILLDLYLPDIDGEEVLRQLKASPATAGIPVVILSADAAVSQVLRLRNAGAQDYLTKPIDMSRFLAIIDAVALRPANRGRLARVKTAGGLSISPESKIQQ